MKTTTLAVVTLLATGATAALAQNATPNAPAQNRANLQQQMTNSLQQSGFTEIKIRPGSFLVQARDKSGNPVSMFITPDSMTEVTEVGANATQTTGARSSGADMFRAIPAGDELSSKVVGIEVYNNDNKSIGTIKDLAFSDNGRINGYILSVGGFLGIGDHYVAVRPAAVNLSWNASDKKWHAKMNATADQLKAAPEYKYPS